MSLWKERFAATIIPSLASMALGRPVRRWEFIDGYRFIGSYGTAYQIP
jgi:hypothetical protein